MTMDIRYILESGAFHEVLCPICFAALDYFRRAISRLCCGIAESRGCRARDNLENEGYHAYYRHHCKLSGYISYFMQERLQICCRRNYREKGG